MRFTKSTALAPAIAALATAACATTPAARSIQRGPAADSAAIRHAIERGARGFMNANPDSILSHYSRDIVLSYPGIPDQDYATLEKAYRELPQRPKDIVATTTPTFDEILVDDNLAIVRVRWTTTITTPVRDTVPARTNTRYLRDLQVWRKNEAGEWRFIRGMHYRDSTAAPRS